MQTFTDTILAEGQILFLSGTVGGAESFSGMGFKCVFQSRKVLTLLSPPMRVCRNGIAAVWWEGGREAKVREARL